MKLGIIVILFSASLFASCNINTGSEPAASDLIAAKEFIQAALKGRYDRAADFMLHDSQNDDRLDAVSRMQLSSDEKQGLWDASINIYSRKLINDSTSIIVYSNSFHKENKDTLKVIKKDGKWLVDFKYLFNHE